MLENERILSICAHDPFNPDEDYQTLGGMIMDYVYFKGDRVLSPDAEERIENELCESIRRLFRELSNKERLELRIEQMEIELAILKLHLSRL